MKYRLKEDPLILDFTLDNQPLSEDLEVLIPLSHFLSDLGKEGFLFNPAPLKLIIVDNVLVSSRHMPLLLVNNTSILTKEGIEHSAIFQATKHALARKSLFFCPRCEASRFILFYHLMQQKKRDHSQDLWHFHQSQACHCLSFSSLRECFLLSEKTLKESSS